MGGYGEGTLTVIPEGQAPLRPDMDFVMGALGVRRGCCSTAVMLRSDAGCDSPTSLCRAHEHRCGIGEWGAGSKRRRPT